MFRILLLLIFVLSACSSAPATPEPEPQGPPPTKVALKLVGDQPHASFEAFAKSVGSVDFREEKTMLGAKGKGAASEIITTGGLVSRDGATQRVLLAGKAGALYELAVLDSWSEKPDYLPYAQVQVRESDLPDAFVIAYDAGRTKEVEGGTSYDHKGTAMVCREQDARFACAAFTTSKGSYVEPKDGASKVKIPEAVVMGRKDGRIEVVHLVQGEGLTPAGYYVLEGP